MITTNRKVVANRANSSKSTGPRTKAGKERSSQNALTHGLLSQCAIVPGEEPALLEAFRADLMARLDPWGAMECLLADRVVSTAWRLRRAARYEGRLTQEELDHMAEFRRKYSNVHRDKPERDTGKMVKRLLNEDLLPKLSRYESRIERGLYRALHELQRMQAARRGEPVAVPVAVDVDVHTDGA